MKASGTEERTRPMMTGNDSSSLKVGMITKMRPRSAKVVSLTSLAYVLPSRRRPRPAKAAHVSVITPRKLSSTSGQAPIIVEIVREP